VKDLVILSELFWWNLLVRASFLQFVSGCVEIHSPRRIHCMIHLEELELGWRIVIGGGFCACGRL
jgi:hypothetical protein